MLYIRNCIIALVTPWGRLSAAPFAAMALALIAVHCLIQMHITELGEDVQPYNVWSMTLFLLMWLGFCITSRRFHDSGKTAFFLVPLLVITFASYLAVLDDLHLATSVFDEDRELLRWAERARFVLQVLGLVAMVAALMRPGDFGDNAFGREFYNSKSAKAAKSAARVASVATAKVPVGKVAAAQSAAEAPKPKRHDFLANGPRGRITPAESTRHRGDGFGRR